MPFGCQSGCSFLSLSSLLFPRSEPGDRFKWLDEVHTNDVSSTDNCNDNAVGKLASPCGTIRVHSQNSNQIADGQSPSNLLPGKLMNMQSIDPTDLSQTTTSTTITNTAQKEEWFVWAIERTSAFHRITDIANVKHSKNWSISMWTHAGCEYEEFRVPGKFFKSFVDYIDVTSIDFVYCFFVWYSASYSWNEYANGTRNLGNSWKNEKQEKHTYLPLYGETTALSPSECDSCPQSILLSFTTINFNTLTIKCVDLDKGK